MSRSEDRSRAVTELGEQGRPEDLGKVLDALRGDPDASVRGAAAQALGEFGGPGAPALCEALGDKHPEVRRGASWGIAFVVDSMLERLEGLAREDPDVSVRETAVEALGAIAGRDLASTFRHALDDPAGPVRRGVKETLLEAKSLPAPLCLGAIERGPRGPER